MALYLGQNKVTPVGLIGSMKFFFEAGGKCAQSKATSFEGCWQYGDTENVTDMYGMFINCRFLTTIPQFDTSNVTNMENMFSGCYKITSIPKLNIIKVTSMGYIFVGCSSLEEIHMININTDLDISASTKFTREALLEIIGNLKAQTSGTKTLTMGETNLAKLTEADKKIATDKGWALK